MFLPFNSHSHWYFDSGCDPAKTHEGTDCSNGIDCDVVSGLPSIGPNVHFHSRRRLTRLCRGVWGVDGYGSASRPSNNATARTCLSMRNVRRFLRSSFERHVRTPVSSALPSSVLDSETDKFVASESDSEEVVMADPSVCDSDCDCTLVVTLLAVWVTFVSVLDSAPLSASCTASSYNRSRCCAVYFSVRISSSRL